jgi:hypothetical protein
MIIRNAQCGQPSIGCTPIDIEEIGMNKSLKSISIALGVALSFSVLAQAPATPPSSNQPTPAAVPMAKTPTAPLGGPAASAPMQTAPSTQPMAATGGPGQVWLNSKTKVYHCFGSKYYGKTVAGSYMTEDQAKAAGGHADHGKTCS